MTSKNLFFNLMRENTRRRLWVTALIALVFFFLFPVWTALMISDYLNISAANGELIDEAVRLAQAKSFILERFLEWISINNGLTVLVMMVAAVICGVSGFSYLHSKQKADFYHSLPVKREKLFVVNYINGILYTAVPYLICLVISSVLVMVKAAPALPWGRVLAGFAQHMCFYILIYSTVILAVMLTGSTIVSVLGSTVFFLYGPCVVLLKYGYFATFFKTFYSGSDSFPSALLARTSPLAWYISSADRIMGAGSRAVWALVIAVVLTAITVVLYKKRPSEAAGKAMAFKISQPVIKVLLVVPAALFGGLFFYELKGSDGWAVFGLLSGLIITYCIVEIIYNFDFRRLFAHKVHLAACVLICGAVFSFFRFDLSGYDSYVPSADKIESAGFYSYYLDGGIMDKYYIKPELTKENNVIFNYDSERTLLQNMKLSDTEDILAIARQGVKDAAEDDGRYRYGDAAYSWDTRNEEKLYTTVTVCYHLKNGRNVLRNYYLDLAAVKEAIYHIYGQKEYKETAYPLLLTKPEEIAGVNYQEYDDYRHVSFSGDGSKEKLLTAYQKELSELTAETREQESPIGALQFKTNEMQQMIDRVRENKGDFTRFNDYGYYPVYPSFTETIALLKQCGIDAGHFLNRDNVDHVELTFYDQTVTQDTEEMFQTASEDTAEYHTIVIRDKNQIEDFLALSLPQNPASDNRLNPRTDKVEATAFVVKNPSKKAVDEFYNSDKEAAAASEKYDAYRLVVCEDNLPAVQSKQWKNSFD